MELPTRGFSRIFMNPSKAHICADIYDWQFRLILLKSYFDIASKQNYLKHNEILQKDLKFLPILKTLTLMSQIYAIPQYLHSY